MLWVLPHVGCGHFSVQTQLRSLIGHVDPQGFLFSGAADALRCFSFLKDASRDLGVGVSGTCWPPLRLRVPHFRKFKLGTQFRSAWRTLAAGASLLARAAESSHRHRSQENAEIPEVRPAPLPAPGPWGSEPAGTPVKNSCVAPGPWEHVCYAEPLGAKRGQGDAHLPRLLS